MEKFPESDVQMPSISRQAVLMSILFGFLFEYESSKCLVPGMFGSYAGVLIGYWVTFPISISSSTPCYGSDPGGHQETVTVLLSRDCIPSL